MISNSMHAFDMLRDDALSREAIQKFDAQFEKPLENLREKQKIKPPVTLQREKIVL